MEKTKSKLNGHWQLLWLSAHSTVYDHDSSICSLEFIALLIPVYLSHRTINAQSVHHGHLRPSLVYECSAVRVSAYLCRSKLSKAVRLLLGCFTSELQSVSSCYFGILGLHSLGVSCLAHTSFHSGTFLQLACCKYLCKGKSLKSW